jgi:formate hydrogenlyase transcriptional activator
LLFRRRSPKRREDIPFLVEYFVKRFAEKLGRRISKIGTRALEPCEAYPWPGIFKSCRILSRSVILCSGDISSVDEAWFSVQDPLRPDLAGKMTQILQDQEKETSESALAESGSKVAGGRRGRRRIPSFHVGFDDQAAKNQERHY